MEVLFPKDCIFYVLLHTLQTKILNQNKVCPLAGLQCQEIKSNYTLCKMHLGNQLFFQKILLTGFLLGKGALFVSLPSLFGRRVFCHEETNLPQKVGKGRC